MQASEDRDGKDADNVKEHVKIVDEKLELERQRAQTTEYSAQDFVTRSEIQNVIATEMKKSTPHRNATVLTGVVEEKLIDVLQVVYDATQEEMRTSLFNLVGEATFDIIQQGMMDLLLVSNVEALTQPDRLMDT